MEQPNNEATRRFLLNSHCRGEVEQLVTQEEEIEAESDTEFSGDLGEDGKEDVGLTKQYFLEYYE
ncbi:hypothetical protein ABE099_00800 [Paenibacillus turicensis]|uniref:hypothetical protein n=1 Tax=Paenibacillus turicensis TaxID=160487 RepID=UPI003D277940